VTGYTTRDERHLAPPAPPSNVGCYSPQTNAAHIAAFEACGCCHGLCSVAVACMCMCPTSSYGTQPCTLFHFLYPQELLELNLVPEEWGGQTPMVPVSAKKGTGIPDLLQVGQRQRSIGVWSMCVSSLCVRERCKPDTLCLDYRCIEALNASLKPNQSLQKLQSAYHTRITTCMHILPTDGDLDGRGAPAHG
jgi:hypothetical protein